MWVRVLTDAVHERRDVVAGCGGRATVARSVAAARRSDQADSMRTALQDPSPSAHGEPDSSRDGRRQISRAVVRPIGRATSGWICRATTRPTPSGTTFVTASCRGPRALANAAGGHLPLTVEALLDALPELPLPSHAGDFSRSCRAAVRGGAPGRGTDVGHDTGRACWSPCRRKHSAARWPSTVPRPPTLIDQSRGVCARDPAHARRRGGESGATTADSSRTLGPDERPTDPKGRALDQVGACRARARRGTRAGPAEPSSAALLQLLVEEHPADALHFFRVLRAAGISPAALLVEPVSPRLFESSLMMLPDRTGTIVTLLLRLVSRLPAHEQPGDEDGIRSAAMGAVLDHLIVLGRAGSGEARTQPRRRRASRALWVGDRRRIPFDELVTDAEGLTRAGEWSVEDLDALREALDALGYAASVDAHAIETEREPESALAQQVVRLPPAAARRVDASAQDRVRLAVRRPAG